MSEADNDAMFTDPEGVPTLFDVAVPGDALRGIDYRLPRRPSQLRDGLADHADEDSGERFLEETLRTGIRRHFPGIFASSARAELAARAEQEHSG